MFRLDYCNVLLNGICKKDMDPLQKLQNKCARMIYMKPRYEHVTPLLKDLDWLPFNERIKGPLHDPQPHPPIFLQENLDFYISRSLQVHNTCVQNISCKFICLAKQSTELSIFYVDIEITTIAAYATL